MLKRYFSGVNPYQNCPLNFPIGFFSQNQLDTIGHNWIQLDFCLTHFRPNCTQLDFSPTRQNWFQLDIILLGNKISIWKLYWEVKFTIGKNKIQLIPIHLNQTNWVQLDFQLDWVGLRFYSNWKFSIPIKTNSRQLNPIHSKWISNWNELAILVREGNYKLSFETLKEQNRQELLPVK